MSEGREHKGGGQPRPPPRKKEVFEQDQAGTAAFLRRRKARQGRPAASRARPAGAGLVPVVWSKLAEPAPFSTITSEENSEYIPDLTNVTSLAALNAPEVITSPGGAYTAVLPAGGRSGTAGSVPGG